MIPANNTLNLLTFEPLEMPSRTYGFDLVSQRVRGNADQLEAMRQAVYLIIYTERYQYPIYSWNYGAEFADLIGQPISYVLSEIKRRITEALLQDDRINSVDSWEFDVQRGKVKVTFLVHTNYGEINTDVEVMV